MKTQKKQTAYDPSWIIELVKKQRPDRPDIISALKDCTACRWDSPAYAYFNEGLPLNGGAMVSDKKEGLIIIDMTECGRVAGIEFVNKIPGPPHELPAENKSNWNMTVTASENPEDFKTSYTPAGFPLWKKDY
jgi:hypothetical protein